MERDVVCGMQVDQSKAAGTSQYNGKTYYFCSNSCKTNFDADPTRYAKWADRRSPADAGLLACAPEGVTGMERTIGRAGRRQPVKALIAVMLLAATLLTMSTSADAAGPGRSNCGRSLSQAVKDVAVPPAQSCSGPQLRVRAVPPRLPAQTLRRRDSVWNGLLIGAALGGGSGYLWSRAVCGSRGNDRECLFRATPAGVAVGAGIGAGLGALFDSLRR